MAVGILRHAAVANAFAPRPTPDAAPSKGSASGISQGARHAPRAGRVLSRSSACRLAPVPAWIGAPPASGDGHPDPPQRQDGYRRRPRADLAAEDQSSSARSGKPSSLVEAKSSSSSSVIESYIPREAPARSSGLASPRFAARAAPEARCCALDFAGIASSSASPANARSPVSAQAPRHQRMIAFCTCSRFSASSKTTECGPSITALVTSSPRWAGRQCMKSAPGLACAMSASSTW